MEDLGETHAKQILYGDSWEQQRTACVDIGV